MYVVKQAHTKLELDAIIQLRYKVLRAPWQQPITTTTDELENTSINAYIEDENKNIIACGRLQENKNKIGQIRFMAVDSSYQGKGLGKLIVGYLEQEAKPLQLKTIELQARENAVKFYETCNYTIKEKSFLLWDIIQHYLMEKNL
jgi:N-acetylglutamate synthase-like GNAT family acetyltransferase